MFKQWPLVLRLTLLITFPSFSIQATEGVTYTIEECLIPAEHPIKNTLEALAKLAPNHF